MTSKSHPGSVFRRAAGRAVRGLVIGLAVRGVVIGLAASGLLISLAVAPPFVPAAWAASPDVTVSQGRMQVLLPSRPAAGYFTVKNQGDTPLVLSGASAPDCQSLMLHQSTTDGGMVRMAMVPSMPVPPHGSVSFSPGGYHLMCMQPSGALLTHQGSETVTLRFADGGSVSAPFAVQGVGGR
jgi:periplasmic copper chaperone A